MHKKEENRLVSFYGFNQSSLIPVFTFFHNSKYELTVAFSLP